MHTPATALNAPRSALALCAAAALLAGCGGGGSTGTGGAPSAPTNASPGGIWNGTDQATGLALLGLVTESGEFHFIRSDDTQYFGTLSGTVQARASLTGAITRIDARYNASRLAYSLFAVAPRTRV